jgi:hypothetical protein
MMRVSREWAVAATHVFWQSATALSFASAKGERRCDYCWEYGTATGGSVPFTWLKSDRKVVQGEVEELGQRGAVD